MAEKQAFDASSARLAEMAKLGSLKPTTATDKPKRSWKERFLFPVGIPAFAAAAAALLIVLVPQEPEEDFRVKGNDSFVLFVKRDQNDAKVLGKTCHPGDQLRARYETKQYLGGKIIDIDKATTQ